MNKQKLIKRFPIIRKIRKKQINLCFYLKMYLDKNKYCKERKEKELPYSMTTFKDKMVNTQTGYPIEYQYNKVFNLQLAGKQINHLLIKPKETFSFYIAVKDAEKKEKYRKGLTLVDGKIAFIEGGGLCQISNLLFQVFLNSSLTIVERHTHKVKDFPDPMEDTPKGIDSAIAEGFLDLKVRNDTENTFQISITFDDEYIYAKLLAQNKIESEYKIKNENLKYIRNSDKIYEQVDIYRQEIKEKKVIKEEKLYTNKTQIGYKLPEDIKILENDEN